MNFIEFISQPWHWSISGLALVSIMTLLLWFGGEFGVSSNLRTFCAIGGAGNTHSFFDFNWKKQIWNLVFIGGAIIGGFIAVSYLPSSDPVQISDSTQIYLESVGINAPATIAEGRGYLPTEIFGSTNLFSFRSFVFLIAGGFLVGFGSRYAGGCTSGHAINGLSSLQIPSLIAVVGFFIGGLLMSWIILPKLLIL